MALEGVPAFYQIVHGLVPVVGIDVLRLKRVIEGAGIQRVAECCRAFSTGRWTDSMNMPGKL